MSNEQIFNTLSNIRSYCERHSGCEDCKFNFRHGQKMEYYCQIEELGDQLRYVPTMWDMFEIGAILDD